jgi:hypothetical protein
MTESYHIEHGNVDQYITLQVFKGCDIMEVLATLDVKSLHQQLNDYYLLLSSSFNGK